MLPGTLGPLRPLPRTGLVPADGPDHWTAGTLFPGSSRKVARAINAASGSTGFTLPGIIDEPGCIRGRLISLRPARGPEAVPSWVRRGSGPGPDVLGGH